MKKIFTVVVFCVFCTTAFAQRSSEALATKKHTKIEYKHEFRLSAGLPVAFDALRTLGGGSRSYNAPSLAFGYRARVFKGLFLGVSGVYNNYTSTNFIGGDIGIISGRVQTWNFMADIKYDWYNGGLVTLYSEVGLGINFENDRWPNTLFAWGVTPIGITVGGKHWYGLAELNWGSRGVVAMGVGYRF